MVNIVDKTVMFRCWLYSERMFMPSTGQWAKILFSDIRDDLYISDYISEYRTTIHGEYNLSHAGRRFVTLFKRGSLLALIMTLLSYLFTIHVHHILSYMFRILHHSLPRFPTKILYASLLTPMMPTVNPTSLTSLLNFIA